MRRVTGDRCRPRGYMFREIQSNNQFHDGVGVTLVYQPATFRNRGWLN